MGAAPRPARRGIPERIGRYRIVRPLSKGGMALVYEGQRESMGGVKPRVAIKVILPDFADSATFRELFVNEARLGAKLHHQNLVQIQDFDTEDDRFYLVMEYVEGVTLSKLIGTANRNGRPIPLPVICEIGRQVCDGLHYAHEARDDDGRRLGLVHRDIKPSNLIVSPQGHVKVLDFGISKGVLRHEREGSVKGTWGYMAPEQALGQDVNNQADVFSLGVVLWEMATGRALMKGRPEDAIRKMLQDGLAEQVAGALDGSQAPLGPVLEGALRTRRERRYASAADFGRALASLLPDPVSAREQVEAFYREMSALMNQTPAEKAPPGTRIGSSDGEGGASVALGVGVGALAVLVVFSMLWFALKVSGEVVWSAPEPTTEAALPGARPTPVNPAAPERPRPAPVAPPPAEPPPPAASPPAAEPPPGASLTLGALSAKAAIYVDGQLLSPPHGVSRQVDPGRYVVRMVAEDGRSVSFSVELAAGDDVRRIWDFERWEFKR